MTYTTATNHTIDVTVFDAGITTALDGSDASLKLGEAVPATGTARVTEAGKATFTVKAIVDYGSDAGDKTIAAAVTMGSLSPAAAEVTLKKAEASCDVWVGYKLRVRGTIFDDAIAAGATSTLTVGGKTVENAVTCTSKKATVDGWFYLPENSGVTDGNDYSAKVVVTAGDRTFTFDNVPFKKTATHQKSGSFQQGEDSVEYVDENGDTKSVSATRLTSNSTELSGGWYVVYPGETVTIENRMTVSGNVWLILGDGATLNASAGINVSEGCGFYVFGQADNTGTLNATGGQGCAGIGGGNEESSGTIELHGGVIEAHGNEVGAGIGGGLNGNGGETLIAGNAIVRAYGAKCRDYPLYGGAGIGGGGRDKAMAGSSGGTISIMGNANVRAEGADAAAGIGGGGTYDGYTGQGGTITIDGAASVTATGGKSGAGIGAGHLGTTTRVIIHSGTIKATGGEHAAGIGQGEFSNAEVDIQSNVTINGGNVTATGGARGAGIGAGAGGDIPTIDIKGGVIKATGNDGASGIGWGATSYDAARHISISGGQVTTNGINANKGWIDLRWQDASTDYITCTGVYNAWETGLRAASPCLPTGLSW